MREIFHKARAASCIVFFDEIDSLVPKRGAGGSHVTERVISQFLTEMDGIEELKGVVVLAATNRLDLLDPALLRHGRFDLIFDVPLPDKDARERIFKVHTKGKPLSIDVDIKELAGLSDGFAGADIEALCSEASLAAVREFMCSEGYVQAPGSSVGYEGLVISMNLFRDAVDSVKKRRR